MILLIGIYIRVSSETQVKDGYSLTAQKERLTAFCKAQGWEQYKFYVEEGLSAKNTKRPVYKNLMKDVEKGIINTVLVYKLDRIMRSIGELDKMLKTFEEYKCGFKSATEPFDTTNPTGKLFMYIVAAFAQWEIDVSSERISMVLEEKVANEGIWIGNVPYPFDKDEQTQKLVANEERTKTTLKIIELFKQGKSSVDIAEFLTNHNNDKTVWHHNTILRILRNPALCGDTTWNDKIYHDTHKGIISKDEFNKIQQMLDDRSTTRLRHVESTYIFQGKLVCPSCDKIMSVNRFFRKRKDGSTYQGAVHRCPPCAAKKKFNSSPSEEKILDAFYDYMKEQPLEKVNNIKIGDDVPDDFNKLKSIENQRAKYQRAWSTGHMSDDEFYKRMEETREVYEELKELVKNYKKPKPINIEEIKNIIFMFNDNFKLLTNDEKRKFISTFIRKIYFEVIPQPPVRPDKSVRGAYKVKITNVTYY